MTSLGKFLEEEATLIRQFLTILGEEQQALRSGELSALHDLEPTKATLVEKLNALGTQRNALLVSKGLTPDKSGILSWLASHPESSTSVEKTWSEILSLAKQAKELNALNGQLIGIHLRATNLALDVLTKKVGDSEVYGRDGQTSALTGSRIIDSA